MNTDRVLPSPALRHTSRWLVSVGFLLALATQVLAGGEIVTTVQNGNWADFETWDLHIPSSENGDQAVVVHEVDVTEESPETGGLAVGAAAGPGLIDITGSLAVFDGAHMSNAVSERNSYVGASFVQTIMANASLAYDDFSNALFDGVMAEGLVLDTILCPGATSNDSFGLCVSDSAMVF